MQQLLDDPVAAITKAASVNEPDVDDEAAATLTLEALSGFMYLLYEEGQDALAAALAQLDPATTTFLAGHALNALERALSEIELARESYTATASMARDRRPCVQGRFST